MLGWVRAHGLGRVLSHRLLHWVARLLGVALGRVTWLLWRVAWLLWGIAVLLWWVARLLRWVSWLLRWVARLLRISLGWITGLLRRIAWLLWGIAGLLWVTLGRISRLLGRVGCSGHWLAGTLGLAWLRCATVRLPSRLKTKHA